MTKIERLINLIALLLNTERPLPALEIRRKIPGYGDQTEDTFHRMFERDKAELRELGFPLVQEDVDGWGSDGYRISKREALLDDPGLTAEEWAALSLAAQTWGGRAGALGILKLSVAAGAEPGPVAWLLPRVTVDRNLEVLMDALARRKRVRFRYRTGGGGESQAREVDPHGLYHRGSWYVSGFDHGRGEQRVFKLTRVDGRVVVAAGAAPDFDPPPPGAPAVRRGPWEGEDTAEARVAFAPEAAWWAERRTGARRTDERDDGWIEFEIPMADLDQFAAWVTGFGARAQALAPPELEEAVIRRLRRLAGGA